MPPKAKFTKKEVISAALELCRKEGFEALTARALAQKLDASPRPLFTLYSSMEEIAEEARAAGYRYYLDFLEKEMSLAENKYKASGIGYIHFAKKEKMLFQALFMTRPKKMPTAGEDEGVLAILAARYDITLAEAAELHFNIWMYVHGIATMVATDFKDFSEEELDRLLGECYIAFSEKYRKECKK